jgi:hypothetical protein
LAFFQERGAIAPLLFETTTLSDGLIIFPTVTN